jgi:uncharacterized protein YjdB
MKKFYFLLSLLIFFVIIPTNKVHAQDYKSFDVVSSTDNNYSLSSNQFRNTSYAELNNTTYVGDKLGDFLVTPYAVKNEKMISGEFKWTNPDYVIVAGEQYVELQFVDYKHKDTTITFKLYIYGIDKPSKAVQESAANVSSETKVEEKETSLIVTDLYLSKGMSYDLNLADVDNTNYTWTSSDTSIATVNSETGKVKAISNGKVVITCTGSTDDKQAELSANVTIGPAKNIPKLSDDSLSLDVGDTFDIDIENGIKDQKVRFYSSDMDTAKVKSKSGVVSAENSGDANIYCNISKGTTVYLLKCSVEVSK